MTTDNDFPRKYISDGEDWGFLDEEFMFNKCLTQVRIMCYIKRNLYILDMFYTLILGCLTIRLNRLELIKHDRN
ncbi:hypothetical protein CMI37_22375 [Candidatus Pacearchaeota archaeon]|nr:hypothetical protein [Candidatus Pacearchaeota archaeon]